VKLKVGIGEVNNGTNIMEIEVPDILRQRVKSGLAWVDDLFNGGFIRTTTTLFTGTPGAGKTTLMLQLCNALTGKGQKVLFNTGEESLYQTKMVVERLRLRNGFIAGQDTTMEKLLNHADEIDADFLMVDSLQTMNDEKYGLHTNSKTPNRCMEMFTNWSKEQQKCAFIIGQVGKSGQFKGDMTLKHMVDAHLHLGLDTIEKSDTYGLRLLELQKYRFGPGGKTFVLDMRQRGLVEFNGREPVVA
jgi:DNA repair protein RadA/Sms